MFFNKMCNLVFEYILNDFLIERFISFKDLGIIYVLKVVFTSQIDMACSQAIRMLKTIYTSYMRSKLQYGAII